MSQGRKRLEREIKRSLNKKQDKPKLVPALLGAYVNGQKTLTVAGRTDFVWCRIRGSTSEVVQAFNDQVGAHWDLPVLIYRDPNYEGLWKVYGRDITQYEDWEGVSYLPKHGNQHSFVGGRGAGSDPVWVYKRQFMPLLPRPVASGSMSIYVEEEIYHWDGEYHWWPGSGTADLTSYKPTGSTSGKFLTVYIEGSSETLKILEGDEFDLVFASDKPTDYIPIPDSSQGIPVASVMLQTGTQGIGWHEIYDLRLVPSMFAQTGSNVGIYDEHAFQGGVSNFDFVGSDISAVVSGSYAYVQVDIPAVVFPEEKIGVYNTDDGEPLGTGTRIDWGDNLDVSFSGESVRVDGEPAGGSGSVVVSDEGVLLGSATEVDYVGAGVEATISGSRAQVEISGGGGGGETGTVVVYDEDTFIGLFEEVRFKGDGVDVYNSGTYAAIDIPEGGGGGGGGSGSVVVLDEGVVLGSATEIDYVGAGIEATVSGSRAQVEVAGGSGEDVSVTTGTYSVWEKVHSEVLDSDSSFAAITGSSRGLADYDRIEIQVIARSDVASVTDVMDMYFNGDQTDANYLRAAAGGGSSSPGSATADSPQINNIPGDNASSPHYGQTNVIIPEPGSSRRKTYRTNSGRRTDASTIYAWEFFGEWEDTSQITKIELVARNGTLKAGSRVIVWGVREESLVTDVSGGSSESAGIWSMRKGSDQTLTSSQYDEVTFDTEVFASEDSVIDLANNRFTAPEDGYYLAIMSWMWEGTAPSANHICRILVNGSVAPPFIRGSTQDAFDSREGTVPLELSEGDHVTLEMNPSSTSGVVVRGDASQSELSTHFSLVKAGAVGGGEPADIYEDGGLVLADAEELDFDHSFDVSVSGSRAQVSAHIPVWTQRLAVRPDDVHADDDEFADGSISGDWTAVTPSGSAEWEEDAGILSVITSGMTGGDYAVQLKAMTTTSAPITIESVIRTMPVWESSTLFGLVFTDGATASSNAIVMLWYSNISRKVIQLQSGTLTDLTNNLGQIEAIDNTVWGSNLLYARLIYSAANTWKVQISPNGVQWADFGLGSKSHSLTPTHYGVLASNTSAVDAITSFEYFRVYESDESA